MDKEDNRSPQLMILGSSALVALGVASYCVNNWHVAKPSQILIKTGLFVRGQRGMKILKSTMRLPGQVVHEIDISSKSLEFNLNIRTKELFNIKIRASYTISPPSPFLSNVYAGEPDVHGADVNWTSEELLENYAEKLAVLSGGEFYSTIQTIVQGETRVQAANMSLDSINDDREKFRSIIIERVQKILYSCGLVIVNANFGDIEEVMKEGETQTYLEARRERAHSKAINEATVNVAEATRSGMIGAAEHETAQRIRVAELNTSARQNELEQEQKVVKATAELKIVEANSHKLAELAKIDGQTQQDLFEQEKLQLVEMARAMTTLEAIRAKSLTLTKVDAECNIRAAEGRRQASVEEAMGKADAIRIIADANRVRVEMEMQAVANGEYAMLKARATGAHEMITACGNDMGVAERMTCIQNGIPQAIAESASKAVQNMSPHVVSVGDSVSGQLTGIVTSMAPVMDAFNRIWNPSVGKVS